MFSCMPPLSRFWREVGFCLDWVVVITQWIGLFAFAHMCSTLECKAAVRGWRDSISECWISSGPSEDLVSVADYPRWRISLPLTCKCWLGWRKFMILGRGRDLFFSLRWRKHVSPPTSSMPWSADRLFFKDFNTSTLQTAPIGESGLYILQREMDVLTSSSSHCTKFVPTKEFWMWVKIFPEFPEHSATENLTSQNIRNSIIALG